MYHAPTAPLARSLSIGKPNDRPTNDTEAAGIARQVAENENRSPCLSSPADPSPAGSVELTAADPVGGNKFFPNPPKLHRREAPPSHRVTMSDISSTEQEHPGESATEDHSNFGVAHGSSLASISEDQAPETKDLSAPKVAMAIEASEEEPFTSDNELANNSSHRNGYSSEDPPQQTVSLRRNRDELVFRPQQTSHNSPPLGRVRRSQPRPSIHNLSSEGGNVSFVEQSQHYTRRSSYEDPVVKIRHPRRQYQQYENQSREHEDDDHYNYHPSQFQHTYPPNRREHPQHVQPQSGDFGHKRRGTDQGRFQHATSYGASREADMFNTPKYGRLTPKAKDSDLETSGYNNNFRVKFADEVFGDRQGRPSAPHYEEGFPNRLPLEEVVGTAPWRERHISSHSSVDISTASRSFIDGTSVISETANSIRRQLRTSNWPAFARSPNHEQSYIPRKRQAALMSILVLMGLFMTLRHGPENLTMYTTVGDESPSDISNELRPARGIMDDFNPMRSAIQNNPVKPAVPESTIDRTDEEVFDWSKVPPHLRGYYKTMLENAPKIGIEEIPRNIPKLDKSQFEMQQSLLAQNGGFSGGTEVGLMKEQTHPDALQELLRLSEGINDEKRLIQEAESDGRLKTLAAEEFGQDVNLQSISDEIPMAGDLLELARRQHAEIERAEAERNEQLSQKEFEAAQTKLEIADEVVNDAPAMPLIPEPASKEVIDDMALEAGQHEVDEETDQAVLAEQSAQDIPPDEVPSAQSTEEKENESAEESEQAEVASDGESDAIEKDEVAIAKEERQQLLRKEREDERKRKRQEETKALQNELAELMDVLEKKQER